jgi:FkbM family methyltransferase
VTTLRNIGIGATRLAPVLRPSGKWLYSKLPKSWREPPTPTSWLATFFSREPEVIFVQIGAYNGVDGDPIRPLILGHTGWRGALIEPMPAAFRRLRENYAGQFDRLQFLNCAVSNRSGSLDMYEVDDAEVGKFEFPSWTRQVASMSRDHVKKHFPTAALQARTVSVTRMSDVTRSCNLSRVDLLVMDVEGHERTIIEDVDYNLLRIKVILYEHRHMSENEEQVVSDYLKSFGFNFRRFPADTIAYRR